MRTAGKHHNSIRRDTYAHAPTCPADHGRTMMALEDIETDLTSSGVPWRTCAVCHFIEERGDDWAARLRRMLANKGIKFKTLEAKLAADPDEPSIPWEALSRHARAGCSAREHLR